MPLVVRVLQIGGVVVVLAIIFGCQRGRDAPTGGKGSEEVMARSPDGQARVGKIEVTETGFQPTQMDLGAERFVVFRRTSTSTCASVMFPDLGLEWLLPLDTDVTVDLPASARGELPFQCGVAMYKGKVIAR